MSAPTIRRARPDEAVTLSRICLATFTETFGHLYPPADLQAFSSAYAPERLGEELADPGTAAWLAEQDGAFVGYVQVAAAACRIRR